MKSVLLVVLVAGGSVVSEQTKVHSAWRSPMMMMVVVLVVVVRKNDYNSFQTNSHIIVFEF